MPAGLHNDVVEEAQRGMYLIQQLSETGRVEVITRSVGNSAETLYLYLVGAAIAAIGPTTLAIQLVGWSFALATIGLGSMLARRLDPSLPIWLTPLLFASSLWLFHYARTGLRALAAPVMLLAVALLLRRAETSARAAAGAGVVLGLGIYAYTACRVLPLALAAAVAPGLLTESTARRAKVGAYAWLVLAAFLVSIPNLLFLIAEPSEFLLRGSYVVRGGPADWATHLLWTFLLPFHYPSAYRLAVGPTHFTDGVSTSLKLAGLEPMALPVGVAFALGLLVAWKRRREPAVGVLLATWLLGSLLLGFMGPSLTRLLVLLPAYLLLAALGLGFVVRREPRARRWIAVGLGAVLVWTGYRYFVTFADSAPAQYVYSQAATPIGQRAADLAASGRSVLCVVAKDFNTVRYLTARQRDRVRVVEFYRRGLVPAELRLREHRPDALLVAREPSFEAFAARFPESRRFEHAMFIELDLRDLPLAP